MKYSIHINQKQAVELGITNVNQALILDLLTGASVWAEPVLSDGNVYYWVARQAIAKELPILGLKPDTVYRHLKALAEIGVIDHIKVGKKDCIKITDKGKSYYVGNESENDKNSDLNPNHYVGNESENNSDLNPTYQSTKLISLKDNQSLPDCINLDSWNELMEHRRNIKKPVSELAKTKLISTLSTMSKESQQATINKTIENRWTGLFPDNKAGNPNGKHQQPNQERGEVGRINDAIDARARERARIEDLQS